ncbi:aminopeptidase [Desulfosporosinus sp. BICA1-9]|uniref:aminopeptidase n=1 Tax=Desulfosporosinus sp. BICA1-9 TaxID=1531958 RepID=UPI00054B0ACE|nr:aminopeptidase [Desulfosporosinus sp. BICA1-9]KJS49720.1 MAG: peptidase M29 [Peptococcaceae bacterium BRH_c23]KJS88300.1 MAG: peptidase M29 [Desulfosporosinus sp. BICA1-9]HBW35971.1 aminopeptidase [Desulfosporosinus sp.]
MDNDLIRKYAHLIVKTGLNLQPKQMLVITSPIECAPFTRLVSQVAYEAGARDVVIQWKDELFSKIRFLHAPEEVFEEFPAWQKEFYLSYVHQGAAFLSISASDPELMKDVNPDRMTKAQKASSTALKDYRERLMSNKNVWCVVSIPTAAWAMKVFPHLSEEKSIEKLWEVILKTVRVDTQNPDTSWQEHKANLKTRLDFLNSSALKSLHYKNSLGTDLRINLPDNYTWLGGSEYTPDGLEFIANLPTEEVFTLPEKTGVNGIVVSSMPLNYNGNLIEQFSLTFKDGRIIDFSAQKGFETLKNIIETDEGSHYLGEVALVPFDSPISNSKILFFNTLFDENASCHLAIGKAYPVCLENGANLTPKELEQAGVNDSLVHVDFMIGTSDLDIIGFTVDEEEVPIFKDGNFAFRI